MGMDDDDDALQNEGTEESVPEVPKEAEKKVESFQEQRGRKPEKKQAGRADGGEISSRGPGLESGFCRCIWVLSPRVLLILRQQIPVT